MQTLRANGMNPVAKPCRIEPRIVRSPPQRPPSGLFSPPQPADVRQLPLDAHLPSGSFQPPQQARLWRRYHVDNQKLYDVNPPSPELACLMRAALWHVGAAGSVSESHCEIRTHRANATYN